MSQIKLFLKLLDQNIIGKSYFIFRNLSAKFIPRLRKSFLFDIERETRNASNFLKEFGFIKIKALSKLNLKELNEITLKEFQGNSITIPSSYSYHYDDILRLAKENNCSIIDKRGVLPKKRFKKRTSNHEMDLGINDIFFPQYSLKKKHLDKIKKFAKEIDKFMLLINKRRLNHLNIYFYKNVKKPRCFHSDYMLDQYKVFLYLDNISNIEQGPYGYLHGSHKGIYTHLQKLTRYIIKPLFGNDLGSGTWDGLLFNSKSITPLFAKKWEIIITHNRGIHGDFPAEKNCNRRVIVLHYG